MKEHNEFPMKVILHMQGEVREFHCDVAAFLDPMGNWFGVIVDDEPVFSAPKNYIDYIEYVYYDKEEKEETTRH